MSVPLTIQSLLLVLALGCFIWSAWSTNLRWTPAGLAFFTLATLLH